MSRTVPAGAVHSSYLTTEVQRSRGCVDQCGLFPEPMRIEGESGAKDNFVGPGPQSNSEAFLRPRCHQGFSVGWIARECCMQKLQNLVLEEHQMVENPSSLSLSPETSARIGARVRIVGFFGSRDCVIMSIPGTVGWDLKPCFTRLNENRNV